MMSEKSIHLSKADWDRYNNLLSIKNMPVDPIRDALFKAKPNDRIDIASVTFHDGVTINLALVSDEQCYHIATSAINADGSDRPPIGNEFKLFKRMHVLSKGDVYTVNFVVHE